jgi:hypothetical protein
MKNKKNKKQKDGQKNKAGRTVELVYATTREKRDKVVAKTSSQ